MGRLDVGMLEHRQKCDDDAHHDRRLGGKAEAADQAKAAEQRPADHVQRAEIESAPDVYPLGAVVHLVEPAPEDGRGRSEEHTSELQSLMRISYAFCCLKQQKETTPTTQ